MARIKKPVSDKKPEICTAKAIQKYQAAPLYSGMTGRPPIDISSDVVQRMAEEQCTARQIAAVVGCHVDTIYERFADVLHRGQDIGRRRLIAAMWDKAIIEKDCKMQIWLSKQHLGYKDTMPEQATQITFNIQVNEIPQ